MYYVINGERIHIVSLGDIDKVLVSRGVPEYIDVLFGITRQAVRTLCKVFSLLPPERRASVICYVDASGDLYARYRLLSGDDCRRLGRAVLYYEAVGPSRRFGILQSDTAEEAVLKMSEFEGLRVIFAILGILEIGNGSSAAEDWCVGGTDVI